MTNKRKPGVPPIPGRDDFEHDEEYREYLDLESDTFNPPPATKAQRREAARIATNTIERIAGKKIPVGLRLPARDLQRVKSVALQRGIPYQTLISSIVHQYLDGNLVEK